MTTPPRPVGTARAHTRLLAAAATASLVLFVAACSGDEPAAVVTAPAPTVPVLQPGTPGQPNATITGSAAAPTATVSILPTDERFLSEMIVHHA
ncbi:MAG TPA: hypothetical protein PLE20_09030, partial [Ornithinibacter sp.]|nr:hypothetical protein [Ornithinibacter sp.]